ncbi:MAG: ThiF family adenylyltransferase [Planctomycetota bacterium]
MSSDDSSAEASDDPLRDPAVRYAKQVRFEPLGGEAAQRRLAASHVVLCGCGALGSAVADQLVRAGVGRLTIVDRDFVEASNLQRQSLFTEDDARERLPKAVAATERLRAVNGLVSVEPTVADMTAATIGGLCENCDLIVDGTDNFATRLLLNDYAVRESIPWVYGGVVGAEGRVMPIVPGRTACLACLLPEPPGPGETLTCDSAGVLGPAVGVVASLQAIEAMKLLAGAGEALSTGLTVVDLWSGRWRRLDVPRDPNCRACGLRRFDWLEADASGSAAVLCGRNAVQISPPAGSPTLDFATMRATLAPLGEVSGNAHLLRFRPSGDPAGEVEVTLFRDGRAIVGGVEEESIARSVLSRCLGV